MIGGAALLTAIAAVQAPVAAQPPQVAVTVLVADAYGQRGARRSDVLDDRTAELLFTLHDVGALALHYSGQPAGDFTSCFGARRVDAWETAVARCAAARLKPGGGNAVPLLILVNDTRSRSSAQQLTCVGPGGAIGEAKAHLADLFHPRPDIRAGVRNRMMACINGALAAPR